MVKAKEFILENFTKSFLTLFVPFFTIIALIYLIRVSNISYKVNLGFIDFLTMFAYFLPHIIFASIPLTFIGAVVNTFSKLSYDNELIAIFSLGYTPWRLLKFLLPTAFLFSLFLTILTLLIIPYADQKVDNFKAEKYYEAKLKILPKKLSQSFGKHHIFIESSSNNHFKNVTMFSQEGNGYMQILLAKKGYLSKDLNSSSYLSLSDGSLYKYKDKNFKIVDFQNLKLYNNKRFYAKKIKKPSKYWKKNMKKFYYYLLISLSPFLTVAMLFALGVFNPRYQKPITPLYILASALFVYIPAMIAKEKASFTVTVGVIILWIAVSIILFKRKLARRY